MRHLYLGRSSGPVRSGSAPTLGILVATLALAGVIPLVSARALETLLLILACSAAALTIVAAARAWTGHARLAAAIFYGVAASVFVLVEPHGPRSAHRLAGSTTLVLAIGATILLHLRAEGFNAFAARAASWLGRHRRLAGLGISALSVLVLPAVAEIAAATIGSVAGLELGRPLMTRYRGLPVADFRPFHITADVYRVPDPHLLWTPVARPPYNSRGFKGPAFAEAKPPQTFRIITVGDSNTDGPAWSPGWTDELRRLLGERAAKGHRFEVINAGVAGYSSLQGLRRLEECLRYSPDLVTVSFGANDAHLVTGSDKEFAIHGSFLLGPRRFLYRYQAYLLARRLASRGTGAGNPETPLQPRVSVPDYEANLERMATLARGAGARVVFFTRPNSPTGRRAIPTGRWIERAASYNEATVQVGQRLQVPVFDAYRLFEESGPEVFADDSHFTVLGHALMAKLLQEFLVRQGLLPAPAF